MSMNRSAVAAALLLGAALSASAFAQDDWQSTD